MNYRFTPESKKTAILLGVFSCACMGFAGFAESLWRSVGFFAGFTALAVIGTMIYFYRDPERTVSVGEDVILSPADGMVTRVEKIEKPRHGKGPALRVAIFMHVGNVHIQRMPSDGVLTYTDHQPGKFRAVLDPKAPIENEQRWYVFENGVRSYALVQIAGLLARRTISWVTPGQKYCRGIRLGMIALGSEVDLYLPETVEISVRPGMKVKAGLSVLGRWTS